MKIIQVFPMMIIIQSAMSMVIYFAAGDWKKGIYWLGATIIGVAVTL